MPGRQCGPAPARTALLRAGLLQDIAGGLEAAVSEPVPLQAGRSAQDGNTLSLQLAPTLALHRALRRRAACRPLACSSFGAASAVSAQD